MIDDGEHIVGHINGAENVFYDDCFIPATKIMSERICVLMNVDFDDSDCSAEMIQTHSLYNTIERYKQERIL